MATVRDGATLMDLIRYRIRAMQNGYWLEALVLAHLFVESQLRLVLCLPTQSGCRIPDDTIDEQRYVMQLATIARNNGIIDEDTWSMIREFNTARNDAVHNLSSGEISYEGLEGPARSADNLISRLQDYYAPHSIGREMRADE